MDATTNQHDFLLVLLSVLAVVAIKIEVSLVERRVCDGY